MKSLVTTLCLLILSIPVICQDNKEAIPDTTKNFKLSGIPFVYYLPESSFGFGVAGIATFRFKDEPIESRPSSFQFGVVYTLKNQILILLPFEFYKKNENIRVEGELGYYKYFYNYFGLGSNAKEEDLEFYNVIFPRFRGTFSRRIGDSPIYAGILYQFDDMRFTKIEAEGLLDTQRPIGWNGGVISNLGFEVQYDNRDNIFTTRKGTLLKLTYHKSASFLGSGFDYTNLSLKATHFIPIRDESTIGFHLFTGSKYGGTPFFDMYYLGTPNIGRGIDDRRYQDKNAYAFQTEFRFPIYKKFGGVTFASLNTVSNKYLNFENSQLIPTIGAGVRYTINKRERNQVRVDFGLYKEGWNIYATAANAF